MEEISSVFLTKKKVIRSGHKFGDFSIADEAKKLTLGILRNLGSHIEIMDFEGNVTKKFKIHLSPLHIKTNQDASIISVLSATGKKKSYDSEGKKLKNLKFDAFTVTSDDGEILLANGFVMDPQGNLLLKNIGKHLVVDAAGIPQQKLFYRSFQIAPNGSYVVAGETCQESYSTVLKSWNVNYHLDNIYIRPLDIKSLLEFKEEYRDQQWKCIPLNLDINKYTHSCLNNSFLAYAGKKISFFGLDGKPKWEYNLPNQCKIRQFYVTPDAKHIFFTLKGRKNLSNLYIIDSRDRKLFEMNLQNRIVSFKTTKDASKIFIMTENLYKIKCSELIVFDIE